MDKRRIIFDSDLLGDDLLALRALARDPRIELVAVTSYGRRTTALERARMAQLLLEEYGADSVTIVPGSSRPLMQEPLRGCTFCDDQMTSKRNEWNAGRNWKNRLREDIHASIYIAEATKREKGLTLLCTGPLTNIATAVLLDPDIPNRIDELVMMGGLRTARGNNTPVAEANMNNDPEAASIVFSRFPRIKVIPLDITLKVTIDDRDREQLNDPFLASIAKACCNAHIAKGQGSIMPLHDWLAYLALVNDSLFHYEESHIEIDTSHSSARGMMMITPTEGGQHLYAYDVDAARAKEIFMETFRSDAWN